MMDHQPPSFQGSELQTPLMVSQILSSSSFNQCNSDNPVTGIIIRRDGNSHVSSRCDGKTFVPSIAAETHLESIIVSGRKKKHEKLEDLVVLSRPRGRVVEENAVCGMHSGLSLKNKTTTRIREEAFTSDTSPLKEPEPSLRDISETTSECNDFNVKLELTTSVSVGGSKFADVVTDSTSSLSRSDSRSLNMKNASNLFQSSATENSIPDSVKNTALLLSKDTCILDHENSISCASDEVCVDQKSGVLTSDCLMNCAQQNSLRDVISSCSSNESYTQGSVISPECDHINDACIIYSESGNVDLTKVLKKEQCADDTGRAAEMEEPASKPDTVLDFVENSAASDSSLAEETGYGVIINTVLDGVGGKNKNSGEEEGCKNNRQMYSGRKNAVGKTDAAEDEKEADTAVFSSRGKRDRSKQMGVKHARGRGSNLVCEICNKTWRTKVDLNKHMRTHSKSKKLTCTVCNSHFLTRAALKKHLSIHWEQKVFECPKCPTICQSSANLKTHLRIHSSIRGFSCSECSYVAKTQKDVSKHMMVHKTLKVYSCPLCKFSSKRKYSLHRHMKNAHSSLTLYECTLCTFKTSAVDIFKVHVAMHATSSTTSCIICGAVIKKRQSLVEHLLGHACGEGATCTECGETFDRNTSYILHFMNQHQKDSPTEESFSLFPPFVFDSDQVNGENKDNYRNDVYSNTNLTSRISSFVSQNRITDTPTIEKKLSQMSSIAARLSEISKGVSPLNEKSIVSCQLVEISARATELAIISATILQSYKSIYGCEASSRNSSVSGSSSRRKKRAPASYKHADNHCDNDDLRTDQPLGLGVITTTVKQEVGETISSVIDNTDMQIQVDFTGEPVMCVSKDDDEIEDITEVLASSDIKETKQLKCTQCNLFFTDSRSLKRHLKVHDDVRPFTCDKCGQSFRRNEHLKKHMVTHSDNRPFTCNACPYAAKTQNRLKIHLMSHSGTKSFACQHCNYTTRTKYDLNHHMKSHEKCECSQCGFVCNSQAELRRHIFIHSQFDCNDCNFSTSGRNEYMKHIKKHQQTQYLCCELCGYSCDTLKKFKYHKLRHENKTPYECPDCEYKCSSRASYDCHRLKHAGLKPYLCSFCGTAFRKTSHLNQHLKIHKGEKSFKCNQCEYSCRTRHNLKEHEMTHSGEKPFTCKFCNFSCRRNKVLQLHLLKHEAGNGMIV